MKKSLWLALVDHDEVPGTRCELFFQANEPSDRQVKARFSDLPKKDQKQLSVAGMFDLSFMFTTTAFQNAMKALKD
jgi:hypothetical protein